jgi:hypothetical protein
MQEVTAGVVGDFGATGTVETYNMYDDKWKIEASDVELNTGNRCLKIGNARFLFS